MKRLFLTLAASILAAGAANAAPNLVTNGGFESTSLTANSEVSTNFGTANAVTGWSSPTPNGYNLYFFEGTASTVDAASRFPSEPQRLSSEPPASPNGGNFLALDGDVDVRSAVEQLITGLTIGKTYTLQFSWAATQLSNRTGQTTEQIQASFGGDTFLTSVVTNPTHGFQGWFTETTSFKATSTSQVLSFLSIGTPSGLPPVALLDGVSLTGVPEAPVWGMLIVGFGLVGFASRRRPHGIVAA